MIKAATLIWLLLIASPARAGDTTLFLKSWGDNRPADRFISLSARMSDAKDGLDLMVLANDAVPIKSVAITSGLRVLASCNLSVCLAFWQKTKMAATNDVLVTVTNADNVKFTAPLRLSRP